MAIDLEREQVLSLRQATDSLPRLRQGRRVHISTVYRWISRGVGGVRLEAVKLGRTLVTSREALQRFADRLTEDAGDGVEDSRAQRERSKQVGRELDRLGL